MIGFDCVARKRVGVVWNEVKMRILLMDCLKCDGYIVECCDVRKWKSFLEFITKCIYGEYT